ncbi:MAG: TRAM domain-containing protein [Myxococcota bacterium]
MNVVEITGVSSDGDGVGRLADGRVAFVPDTFPGDTVTVRLTEEKKRVAHAVVVDRLTESSDRVDPLCTRLRCGGCAWRALDAGVGRLLKRQRVLETLKRIGNVEVDATLLSAPEPVWGYRHRVRLHASYENENWQLGYFARRSHDLVPLIGCPVLWPELEQSCLALAQELRTVPPEVLIQDVEVAYSRREDRAAARIRITGDSDPLRSRLEDFDMFSGVEVVSPSGRWSHGRLTLRYDHAKAAEWDLRFEPGLFTQAFPEVNDSMVDLVRKLVRPRDGVRVLELHAGVGNFSIPLARAGAAVVAVEEVRRSAILNRRNAAAAGVAVEARACTDLEALDGTAYDVLLLDPPRIGARAVAEGIARCPAKQIVYVSCDPATLARDAARLVENGYGIESLHVLDMFPQTPHVESVMCLRRL